jgi:hypothetical protein
MATCVCCGHSTAGELGSSAICPVCFWEDDLVQLRWPTLGGGANDASLIDAQCNFEATGSSELGVARYVRPARDDETVEFGWRRINSRTDNFEDEKMRRHSPGTPWPNDKSELLWWRPNYWRRRDF